MPLSDLRQGRKCDTERIVAIHDDERGEVTLFIREGTEVHQQRCETPYWLLVSDPRLLEGTTVEHEVEELASGELRYLVTCATKGKLQNLRLQIVAKYNTIHSKNLEPHEWYKIPDLYYERSRETQFMLRSDVSLFGSMVYEDLQRLQLHICALLPPGEELYDPEHPDGKIVVISIRDLMGEPVTLDLRDYKTEKDLVREALRLISERNPDIIECSEADNFSLAYLLKRAEHYRIPMSIGRSDSAPDWRWRKLRIAGIEFEIAQLRVAGRHVVSPHQLLLRLAYEQPDAARTVVQAVREQDAAVDELLELDEDFDKHWADDPELVIRAAQVVVKLTDALSRQLLGPEIHITNLLPKTLSDSILDGTVKTVDALMTRAYLQRGHGIPKPARKEGFKGGHKDIFQQGFVGPVVKADIESMYPSIISTHQISPRSDPLKVFPEIVSRLRQMRLEAKHQAEAESNDATRSSLNGQQKALKQIINSAYGYLGSQWGRFNDSDAAQEVTAIARRLTREMMVLIQEKGCTPIEVDTDGVYFVPPPYIRAEADEREFVQKISDNMPDGINVAHDGRWRGMFSYKIGNYALVGYDDAVTLKGGTLKSKNMEPFLRDFIREGVRLLGAGDVQGLSALYDERVDELENHRIAASDFSAVSVIKKDLTEYTPGPSSDPHIELALRAEQDPNLPTFRKGDSIPYYLRTPSKAPGGHRAAHPSEWDPDNPDEDVDRLLGRLRAKAEIFRSAFPSPGEFRHVFQKPGRPRRTPVIGVMPSSSMVKEVTSGARLWTEFAHGVSLKSKKVQRNVFADSEDLDAIEQFIDEHDAVDVHTSYYQYVLDRQPQKSELAACPKQADYVVEVELGHAFSQPLLERTRKVCVATVETICELLAVPHESVTVHYNGNMSFYITVPREVFGLRGEDGQLVHLSSMYQRLTQHLVDQMPREHGRAVDTDLYDVRDLLRIPGTRHPADNLFMIPLTVDEVTTLSAKRIREMSTEPRENTDRRREAVPEAQARFDVIVDGIPRIHDFDPRGLASPLSKRRRRDRRRAILRRREQLGSDFVIPCVEVIAERILSCESTGFKGRAKLITEMRDAGHSEAEVIEVFLKAFDFETRYLGDVVVRDDRPEEDQNATGYRIRKDIWERYMGIPCPSVAQWCDPKYCYRGRMGTTLDDEASPSFDEFQKQSRKKFGANIREATENAERGIALLEGPLACGKTYQTTQRSGELANVGKKVWITEPSHAACDEVTSMAKDKIHNLGPDRSMVHLYGKRSESCQRLTSSCSGCSMSGRRFGEKHPDLSATVLRGQGGVYDLERLRTISNGVAEGKACVRTISRLLAEKADILVMPRAFVINPRLQATLPWEPDVHFDDEGDTFGDALFNESVRGLLLGQCRTSYSDLLSGQCSGLCSECRVSYSNTFERGAIRPRRVQDQSCHPNDPVDLVSFLREALDLVKELVDRGVLRDDVLRLSSVEADVDQLEHYFRPSEDYLVPGEKLIAPRKHFERENRRLAERTRGLVEGMEVGPVFYSERELESYPVMQFGVAITDESLLRGDDESVHQDLFGRRNLKLRDLFTSEDHYNDNKREHSTWRLLNALLDFAEFTHLAKDGAMVLHVLGGEGSGRSCQLMLLHLDLDHFRQTIRSLQRRTTVLMSGTFVEPRLAAASLLLDEGEIDYHSLDVPLHRDATIVLHNHVLGSEVPTEKRKGNPAVAKSLKYGTPLEMMAEVMGQNGEPTKALVFARNGQEVERVYRSLKENILGHELEIEVGRFDKDGQYVTGRENAPGSGEPTGHALTIDTLRSAGSRGVNLPHFDIVYQDGNGRPDFTLLGLRTIVINRSTRHTVSLAEIVDYDRDRAVCQALMRAPRDGAKKRLLIHVGDMNPDSFPSYMRNRIVDTSDVYAAYAEVDSPEGDLAEWQARVLGRYLTDLRWGRAPSLGKRNRGDEGCAETPMPDAIASLPGYTVERWNKIVEVIDQHGYVNRGRDRVGSNNTWGEFLNALVAAEVLVLEASGRRKSYVPGKANFQLAEIVEGI